MSLANLLQISDSQEYKKQGISEERLQAQLPNLRKLVSFYREYPDLLVMMEDQIISIFSFIKEFLLELLCVIDMYMLHFQEHIQNLSYL